MLTFKGSRTKGPAIAAWFAVQSPEFRAITQHWFQRMRACGSDVRELLHDGCPVVCVNDAPFAYVNAFKAHAAVGFFHGATLPDPMRILTGTGRHMRHIKIKSGDSIDDSALDAIISAAYQDILQRLENAS